MQMQPPGVSFSVTDIWTEIDLILRLFAGMAAGVIVGWERTLKQKSAGIRTVGIVGLGPAMTAVALYGAHVLPLPAARAHTAFLVVVASAGAAAAVPSGFLQAWVALAVAVLVLTGTAQAWHVWALALGVGMTTVVDNPARQVFVNELVGPDLLSGQPPGTRALWLPAPGAESLTGIGAGARVDVHVTGRPAPVLRDVLVLARTGQPAGGGSVLGAPESRAAGLLLAAPAEDVVRVLGPAGVGPDTEVRFALAPGRSPGTG